MSQREYLIDLDVNARVRCWHRTERGKVTAFAIQLETYLDGQWRTVVVMTRLMVMHTATGIGGTGHKRRPFWEWIL